MIFQAMYLLLLVWPPSLPIVNTAISLLATLSLCDSFPPSSLSSSTWFPSPKPDQWLPSLVVVGLDMARATDQGPADVRGPVPTALPVFPREACRCRHRRTTTTPQVTTRTATPHFLRPWQPCRLGPQRPQPFPAKCTRPMTPSTFNPSSHPAWAGYPQVPKSPNPPSYWSHRSVDADVPRWQQPTGTPSRKNTSELPLVELNQNPDQQQVPSRQGSFKHPATVNNVGAPVRSSPPSSLQLAGQARTPSQQAQRQQAPAQYWQNKGYQPK
ncbi:hypothetical protein BCR44DRAFT_73182, partial [Catenaria anguillulae PL171]